MSPIPEPRLSGFRRDDTNPSRPFLASPSFSSTLSELPSSRLTHLHRRDSSSSMGVGLAIGLSLLVVVSIAILCLCCWNKSHRKKGKSSDRSKAKKCRTITGGRCRGNSCATCNSFLELTREAERIHIGSDGSDSSVHCTRGRGRCEGIRHPDPVATPAVRPGDVRINDMDAPQDDYHFVGLVGEPRRPRNKHGRNRRS